MTRHGPPSLLSCTVAFTVVTLSSCAISRVLVASKNVVSWYDASTRGVITQAARMRGVLDADVPLPLGRERQPVARDAGRAE